MNGLGKLGGGLAVLAGESAARAKVCGRRALRDCTALFSLGKYLRKRRISKALVLNTMGFFLDRREGDGV